MYSNIPAFLVNVEHIKVYLNSGTAGSINGFLLCKYHFEGTSI